MFKVGDRVKGKDVFLQDNPFATVLAVNDYGECLVNWDRDETSNEFALENNGFWPASDFELVERSKTSDDHWQKIECALEIAVDAMLEDFRPEDAIKYAQMLDDVRARK